MPELSSTSSPLWMDLGCRGLAWLVGPSKGLSTSPGWEITRKRTTQS